MNQQELAERIKQQSNELHTLIEESLNADISLLELELMKSKCVALYDLLLKTKPAQIPASPAIPVKPVIQPTPPPIPPLPELTEKTDKVIPPPALFNDLPPVVEEKKQASLPLENKAAEQPVVIEKTLTELQNEIIDEIVEIREIQKKEQPVPPKKEVLDELSLHEKIASVLPKADLTDRFSSSLASLKTAINVNLKIALVNELFNENTVEYVKAIDKLNNSANIHEAMRFFTELKHTYNWDNDHVLVKELESLISKRFSS